MHTQAALRSFRSVEGSQSWPHETRPSQRGPGLVFWDLRLPGHQKYVKNQPFGLFLEVLGYNFSYFWGPGRNAKWKHELAGGARSLLASCRSIRDEGVLVLAGFRVEGYGACLHAAHV